MTNHRMKISSSLFLLGLLAACTSLPTGPSVLVLPGTGKSFDQFRIDDDTCRHFAAEQNGGTTASTAATESGMRSAAVGTALGATAGAAIGGSRGTGVGAGTGLVFGGLAGTGAANESASGAQQRYDFAYEQCMYAKGHRIPVWGHYSNGPLMQRSEPPPSNPAPPPAQQPR